MSLKVAKTPEGLVARIIRSNGECAYRKNLDNSWAMCSTHKGPWISLNEVDVPKTARAAIAADECKAMQEAHDDQEAAELHDQFYREGFGG